MDTNASIAVSAVIATSSIAIAPALLPSMAISGIGAIVVDSETLKTATVSYTDIDKLKILKELLKAADKEVTQFKKKLEESEAGTDMQSIPEKHNTLFERVVPRLLPNIIKEELLGDILEISTEMIKNNKSKLSVVRFVFVEIAMSWFSVIKEKILSQLKSFETIERKIEK